MIYDDFDSICGSLGGPLCTRARAEYVAGVFHSMPGVVRVELYGSIARDGAGHDIDLIVVTDNKLYQHFVSNVHELLVAPVMYTGAECRRRAIKRLFGCKYRDAMSRIRHTLGHVEDLIDVFVMPIDWKHRIPEMQSALPHNDENFVRSIADDAQVICGE